MPQYLATVELKSASGIAADSAQNSWAIASVGNLLVSDFDAIADSLEDFYNNLGGGISSSVSRGAASLEVSIYELTGHLDGSPHGSPLYVEARAITNAAASGSKQLPNEVAMVLTLRGLGAVEASVEGPGGIRPRQRRSGRIFFGPLNTGIALDTTGGSRPEPTYVAGVLTQLQLLASTILSGANATLSVWSRSAAALYPVVRVEVDNAWDTQRRRGIDASTRAAALVPAP